jgi:hypothetical protein
MTLETRQKWLLAASFVIGAFGLTTALAAHPATAGFTTFLTDLILWPIDGKETLTAPETRIFAAISGGILAGWGVLLWLVSSKLLPREPELARSMILTSITTWFLIDSTASFAAGAPFNPILNTVFLLSFWVPLWSPVRQAEA